MKKVLRVAFIYKKSNPFLSGSHFDNTYYHFFMNALKRNSSIKVTYYPAENSFDTKILKDQTDVILLFTNHEFGVPKNLIGIQELDIPVISMAGDPSVAKESIQNHKKWKIDYYFHFLHEDFFHEIYPKNFKYKTIFFGLEKKLYQNIIPFKDRIDNKILNTGAIGNQKLFSKLISYIKNPKWNAYEVYKLRSLCNKLPYVDYTSTLNHKYINDMFPQLLQKYKSVISATAHNPNIKYWETAAAGCIAFMEITKKNRGEYLGFIDNQSAIFINENNYIQKFENYLADKKNPKWEKIAFRGREHALQNFDNDTGISDLINLMRKLI